MLTATCGVVSACVIQQLGQREIGADNDDKYTALGAAALADQGWKPATHHSRVSLTYRRKVKVRWNNDNIQKYQRTVPKNT